MTYFLFTTTVYLFPGGSTKRIHLPMQETQEMLVQSLGQGDPLEEGMATHSRILAWEISCGLVGGSP